MKYLGPLLRIAALVAILLVVISAIWVHEAQGCGRGALHPVCVLLR